MYYKTKIEDTVRIPPYRFENPLEEVAIQTLNETYEGRLDKKLGLLICVNAIDEISEGRLIMGDGASYHNVVFEAIFFKPEQHEIFDGEVIDIVDYGAFVRIGPMDGLIHVSQVTDDYINYDAKRGALLAKESNKTLDEGDLVRARAVSVSIKDESTNNIENSRNSKIPLTMRQTNLGRFEWIEEAKQKSKKGKE
ncbi:MAG: DNA-directed RNA polymerase [Methanobrevibacter sp.]|uniref:DNA-directed RNA polymerase n=1 Tax=Methanobrevibacter sp. TaxID=66852 RepID=UPI001B5ECF51|nr:DNA-directed RNA polymerase [Methanobrevibacter sp.]MBP3790773.1 DNA-directed RNA polymerase [Methanobrevibacter sp.]